MPTRHAAAALLLATLTACSAATTTPPHPAAAATTAPAPQPPTQAASLSDTEKSDRLTRAHAALLDNNPREVLQLLAPLANDHNDRSDILQILAALALATPDSPDAPTLTAHADQQLHTLLAAHPKDPRLLLLQLYRDNSELRTTPLRDRIADPAATHESLALSLAAIHGAHGHYPQQIAALQLAEQDKPDDPALLQQIFTVALGTKDHSLTHEYLEKLTRINADHANGASFRGLVYLSEHKYDYARDALNDATVRNPADQRSWTALALANHELHDYSAAFTAATHAISLNPNDLLAYRIALRCQIRDVKLDTPENARARAAAALALAPTDPEILLDQDIFRGPEAVIAARTPIAAAHPDDLDNLIALADAYVRFKQPDHAISLLQSALDRHPDDLHIVNALAKTYNAAGQSNNAFTLYEHYEISDDPKIACTVLLLAGDLHHSRGEIDAAIQCFRLAIAKSPPGDDRAGRRLADLYFDINASAQAADSYQALYNGGDKDIALLRRWIESLLRDHQFARATPLLEAQLAQTPDDEELLCLQGYSCMLQNQFNDALVIFNRMLKDHPDNTDALHYRALARFEQKTDLPFAIDDLHHILRINPNAMSSEVLLARIYRLQGKNDEARTLYRRILDTHPGDPATKPIQAELDALP